MLLCMLFAALIVAVSGVPSPRVRGDPVARSQHASSSFYYQPHQVPQVPNVAPEQQNVQPNYNQYNTANQNNHYNSNQFNQVVPNAENIPVSPANTPDTNVRPFNPQTYAAHNLQPKPQVRQTNLNVQGTQVNPAVTFNVPVPQAQPSAAINIPGTVTSFANPAVNQPRPVAPQISVAPQPQPQVFNVAPNPAYSPQNTEAKPQVRPTGTNFLLDAQIGHILRTAPSGAQLISTQPPLPAILARLPDNATLIRQNIVDNFRCEGRNYGYYADPDNDCQIFHVCVSMKQLYPANFTQDIMFQYSFICPEYTIFSQDAMVCAWDTEALPCEFATELYKFNDNFFRIVQDEDGGERYAHVNERLP